MDKIYIPKLSQSEASFVNGKTIPGIIMDANLFATYKKPADTIRKSTQFFILDPCTNYFIGGYYKKKPSFKKLPTTPDKPYKVEKLLSDEGIRKYKFVKESIDYQVQEGIEQIILPYLYSDSVDDTKFNLNLTMISAGLRLIERDQVKLPVYAMINLGIEVFHDISKLNQLIARYSDFKDNLKKYQAVITDNGKCFDIPFIKNNLGINLNQIHIDLRYVLASLGFKGGLKGCEH